MQSLALKAVLLRRRAANLLLVCALVALAAAPSIAAEIIPFTSATVENKNGAFAVQWSAGAGVTAVDIYAGPSPGEIKRGMPLGKGGASGQITITLPPAGPEAPRRYFELVPDHGQSLIVADRELHLATAPNFRDIGGYRTADGKWIRMGMLYRSDQLNLLSDADLNTLRALNIRMVCDLRTESERAGPGADKLPPGGIPVIADVIGSNPDSPLTNILKNPDQVRAAGPAKMEKEMAASYRQLVISKTSQDAYHSMFLRLADPAVLPGVFHCTAGKDRTGWASAVFLSIMGVPRETIVADYLASNALLAGKNARLLAAIPDPAMRAAMEPLTGVRAAYIDAAFDEVTKSFGTIENYVSQGVKLDVPTLRLLRRLYSAGY